MRGARWIKWSALGITVSVLSFVAIVGVAHTPWGRPLLGYLSFLGMNGMNSGCPIGAELDPARAAELRAASLEPLRGATPSVSRRVLGFELGTSRRDEVLTWSRDQGLECSPPPRQPNSSDLRCTGLQLRGTDTRGSVNFSFDPEDRLLDVERAVRVGDAGLATELGSELEVEIAQNSGALSSRHGELTAGYLSRGPLSQSAAEFRFEDMRAQVIVTNMGDGAFSIRGIHQSLL
ncbi:hypothetical protein [Enhygromyxa salina]|uniref:Uncharacterized protein n=1 Tax=Enhygromyxa salina TaxID=215803 RepID=A0A2S9Y5V6_9BACT|nr:hypothetical protein [Enhygromyxa salina]PRQ00478.1 hypothetical protein ENSA7_59720 [Enhygromyxa salina]